jgi:hypothetical protein
MFYASLAPGNPRATTQLDAVVRRTMAASSFTWNVHGGTTTLGEILVYNAPDRIHDYIGSTPIETIAVGSTYYFRASDVFDTDSNGWVTFRYRPSGYSSAQDYAMKFLTNLLNASSVTRSGNTFVAEFADSDDPFASGQVFIRTSIHRVNGKVTSEHIETEGIFVGAGTRVLRGELRVFFSRFGSSPAVVVPAARIASQGKPFCGPATSGFSFCPA